MTPVCLQAALCASSTANADPADSRPGQCRRPQGCRLACLLACPKTVRDAWVWLQAPLSGQHLPSSLGLHAYWPDALQPDAPHPQHSPHQAFCGGPLFTSNWSSLGLPQLPFRSMQQAVKETCSIAGTLSTSGGLLESLADVPLQPPLLKRSRTGEAGEFSLLLDASR